MKIIKCIREWQAIREGLSSDIGLVPTMGNLHDGHMALIQRSVSDNTHTVASLFVNPTQFNDKSDYDNYPKTLAQDIAKLEAAKVDYCFLPDKADMYPDNYTYQVRETEKSIRLEGVHRPGHFEGMLTIVLKLLLLIQPKRAYFGEKDYQQYELIRDMARAFFLNIDIVPCPIVREPSGLALSSRNTRLDKAQKEKAIQFARAFSEGRDVSSIKAHLKKDKIKIDYVEEYDGRRYAAVLIDDIRLIDNYEL